LGENALSVVTLIAVGESLKVFSGDFFAGIVFVGFG
jgi:hypothetical protein